MNKRMKKSLYVLVSIFTLGSVCSNYAGFFDFVSRYRTGIALTGAATVGAFLGARFIKNKKPVSKSKPVVEEKSSFISAKNIALTAGIVTGIAGTAALIYYLQKKDDSKDENSGSSNGNFHAQEERIIEEAPLVQTSEVQEVEINHEIDQGTVDTTNELVLQIEEIDNSTDEDVLNQVSEAVQIVQAPSIADIVIDTNVSSEHFKKIIVDQKKNVSDDEFAVWLNASDETNKKHVLIQFALAFKKAQPGTDTYMSLLNKIALIFNEPALKHNVQLVNGIFSDGFLHLIAKDSSEQHVLDCLNLLESIFTDQRKELLQVRNSREQTFLYYCVKNGFVKAVKKIALYCFTWNREMLCEMLDSHMVGEDTAYACSVGNMVKALLVGDVGRYKKYMDITEQLHNLATLKFGNKKKKLKQFRRRATDIIRFACSTVTVEDVKASCERNGLHFSHSLHLSAKSAIKYDNKVFVDLFVSKYVEERKGHFLTCMNKWPEHVKNAFKKVYAEALENTE